MKKIGLWTGVTVSRMTGTWPVTSPHSPPRLHHQVPDLNLDHWGVICSNGAVMPPYFFKTKERVGAKKYCEVLDEVVIPWMKEVAGDTEFVFQQD